MIIKMINVCRKSEIKMSCIKLFAKIVGKSIAILAVTVVAACTTEIPSPNPQYTFTSADPQTSLVAFTVSCAIYDIRTQVATVYIDHANWVGDRVKPHEHYVSIDCDNFPDSLPSLKILMLPAGDYVFSGIELAIVTMMYTTTYSSAPGEKFYFTLKPHKLTYLGKINYEVAPGRVVTSVANEDLGNAPITAIKHSVPMISPQDYIITTWKRNWLNEIIAQE